MKEAITVLVVEDEAIIRFNLVDELSSEGFDVIEAANSAEAIASLESHSRIRIVFTDVKMPGDMDGLQLAATIRDQWPQIKVIVTSGHLDGLQGALPREIPFFGKPYEIAAVAEAIRSMAG